MTARGRKRRAARSRVCRVLAWPPRACTVQVDLHVSIKVLFGIEILVILFLSISQPRLNMSLNLRVSRHVLKVDTYINLDKVEITFVDGEIMFFNGS
jgi:hypothetical protein